MLVVYTHPDSAYDSAHVEVRRENQPWSEKHLAVVPNPFASLGRPLAHDFGIIESICLQEVLGVPVGVDEDPRCLRRAIRLSAKESEAEDQLVLVLIAKLIILDVGRQASPSMCSTPLLTRPGT